ncbi:hypothetical protein SLNWT_3478 [Streptomyces albus]|uniref:Uncharacterized protein n=1 Tax=Streptomyces albus (strain ATCC 21838 / DSM 41398 / FERM P-419 / JCM 4703 / NBRC 107858) TaxID=1081613 RepID=A0A0B5EQI5_STRA4|nr:hypothetical protein SLNWT_3478 [Streptomyces albus]
MARRPPRDALDVLGAMSSVERGTRSPMLGARHGGSNQGRLDYGYANKPEVPGEQLQKCRVNS